MVPVVNPSSLDQTIIDSVSKFVLVNIVHRGGIKKLGNLSCPSTVSNVSSQKLGCESTVGVFPY